MGKKYHVEKASQNTTWDPPNDCEVTEKAMICLIWSF